MASHEIAENRFLQFMVQHVDEPAYATWKKRVGIPTLLPDEIAGVGAANFVAFFNKACLKNTCIYDLSLVEELYHDEGYDSLDEFHGIAEFACVYCDQNIRFGDFYTAQELTDDVEMAFHQAEMHNVSQGTIKRRNSRKATVSSIRRPGNLPLLNLKPAFDPMESVPELSSPEPSYTFPWGQNPAVEKLLKLELPSFSEFDKGVVINKASAYSGMNLELADEALGFRNQWNDRGDSYSPPKVTPSLSKFSVSKMSRFWIQEKSVYILGEYLDTLPSRSEIIKVLGSWKANPVLKLSKETLQMQYWFWKVRVLQDTAKHMSMWFVDVTSSVGEFGETVQEYKIKDSVLESDPRMLLAFSQFDTLTFCLVADGIPLLVQYFISTKEARYVNPIYSFIEKQVRGPHFDERRDLAFEILDELNKSYLGGQTISNKSSIDFHVNGDASSYFNSYCIAHYYNFEKKNHRKNLPESVQQNANEITKWIILDTKLLVPVDIDPEFRGRSSKRRQGMPKVKDPNESFLDNSQETPVNAQTDLAEGSRISAIEPINDAGDMNSRQSIMEVVEPPVGQSNSLKSAPEAAAIPKVSQFASQKSPVQPIKLPDRPEVAKQTPPKKKATFHRGASLDSQIKDKSEEERLKENSIESVIGLLKFYKRFDLGRYEYLREKSENKFGKYMIKNLLEQSGATLGKIPIKSILKVPKTGGEISSTVKIGEGKYSLNQPFLMKSKKGAGHGRVEEVAVVNNPQAAAFQPRILKTGMFVNNVPLPLGHTANQTYGGSQNGHAIPHLAERHKTPDVRDARASSRGSGGSRSNSRAKAPGFASRDSVALPQINRGRSQETRGSRNSGGSRMSGLKERLPPLSLESLHRMREGSHGSSTVTKS